MFDELKKYKNTGHFFFKNGDSLLDVSRNVPELPGIYYILRLAKGKIDLVYIGKSGPIQQDGTFKDQTLRGRINNKRNGQSSQEFFETICREQNIDALDIYWFVTMEGKHRDIPAFIEGLLLQKIFDIHGHLPEWNRSF